MLQDYYKITPEKSSLFSLIAAIAFMLTTPVAFILRRRNFKRRSIIFFALLLLSVGFVIRTGNLQWLSDESHIVMVYVGYIINGSTLALLSTTVLPEMMENL